MASERTSDNFSQNLYYERPNKDGVIKPVFAAVSAALATVNFGYALGFTAEAGLSDSFSTPSTDTGPTGLFNAQSTTEAGLTGSFSADASVNYIKCGSFNTFAVRGVNIYVTVRGKKAVLIAIVLACSSTAH